MISWMNRENNLHVELTNRTWLKIIKKCNESYPNETGGILVGEYNRNLKRARICEIYCSNESISKRFNFIKRPKKINQFLLDLWNSKKFKQFFVGEWHSHPGYYPYPSSLDDATMYKIAADYKCACSRPILIIPTGTPRKWFAKRIWVYTREKIKLTLDNS